jgi:hypothetical protein
MQSKSKHDQINTTKTVQGGTHVCNYHFNAILSVSWKLEVVACAAPPHTPPQASNWYSGLFTCHKQSMAVAANRPQQAHSRLYNLQYNSHERVHTTSVHISMELWTQHSQWQKYMFLQWWDYTMYTEYSDLPGQPSWLTNSFRNSTLYTITKLKNLFYCHTMIKSW